MTAMQIRKIEGKRSDEIEVEVQEYCKYRRRWIGSEGEFASRVNRSDQLICDKQDQKNEDFE